MVESSRDSRQETMHECIWTTLFIVGFCAALLVTKGLGVFAQTQIRMDNALVSLTHAAADVGAIDLYIDRHRVVEGLQISDSAVYIPVALGKHLVDVFPAGGSIVLMNTTDLSTK